MQRQRSAFIRHGAFAGDAGIPEAVELLAPQHTLPKRPLAPAARPNERPAQAGAKEVLTAELLQASDMPPLYEAWRDLSARSLEANAFLDPDFALPALYHLRPPRRLRMLVVVATDLWGSRRLVALLPIILPLLPFGGIARAYVHQQAALGTPLLDRELAKPAVTTLMTGLKRLCPTLGALIFAQVPKESRTLALLRAEAAAQDGVVRLFSEHERAVLFDRQAAAGGWRQKSKARKNMERLRRRLSDRGEVSYRICRGHEAASAMAEFLNLEARGWKGARRTALDCAPARGSFAREVARLMGERGTLRIDSLDVDGRAVAMGIILDAGGWSYFWKTAYDETLAALSPGVRFVQEFTERQLAGEPKVLIDSCATPNHPMIDRLWPDRIAITDVGIFLLPSRFLCCAVFTIEALRRTLRRTAKTLVRWAIGSRRGASIGAVFRRA